MWTGGETGGYLIQAMKNVFGHTHIINYNLTKIIKHISVETMRLIKGEAKRNEEHFAPSNNPARQVVEYATNIQHDIFFFDTIHTQKQQSQVYVEVYL